MFFDLCISVADLGYFDTDPDPTSVFDTAADPDSTEGSSKVKKHWCCWRRIIVASEVAVVRSCKKLSLKIQVFHSIIIILDPGPDPEVLYMDPVK
jgi:hypothetical protein